MRHAAERLAAQGDLARARLGYPLELMNPRIFREYDIRGVADRDLPDHVVCAIGQVIGERAGRGEVLVGRDCRLTSPRLYAALIDGIHEHAEVNDIGVVPTPVAYFAQQYLKPAMTVMITGSHNPPEDNGFKIMAGAETLYGAAIADLRDRTAALLAESTTRYAPRGALYTYDVTPAYLDRAVSELRLGPRRPKVVVDAGNGSGGPTAIALYTRLGFDVIPLYCEMDGRFPHHHPDPTQPENLAALILAVQHLGAELGIALDGDADRIGAVDATGRVLWGDQLMILLGRAILVEAPDARFVAEVKCSQALYDALPSTEMWKVGHSLIKARMRETGALLAGEMSGHLFFAHRWLGFDDGIYAGARLLELLSRSDRTLADLANELPRAINTPELRVDCPDDVKFTVVDRVAQRLRADPTVVDVIEIDGVRARFANGWGLVRASNTQAALVVRCEARDQRELAKIRGVIEAYIAAARATA
jgi:phosphomannomutase / phosphoglucomutase